MVNKNKNVPQNEKEAFSFLFIRLSGCLGAVQARQKQQRYKQILRVLRDATFGPPPLPLIASVSLSTLVGLSLMTDELKAAPLEIDDLSQKLQLPWVEKYRPKT